MRGQADKGWDGPCPPSPRPFGVGGRPKKTELGVRRLGLVDPAVEALRDQRGDVDDRLDAALVADNVDIAAVVDEA